MVDQSGSLWPFAGEVTRSEVLALGGRERRDDRMNMQECFSRFDDVKFWRSNTRDLIADAESYSHAVFQESFRELRRESRRAEFLLVLALYQIEQGIEDRTSDGKEEL